MTKRALIFGITGQDGSYLAELLLEKGYEVHGVKRRVSLFHTHRIDHLYQDPHEAHTRFFIHYGDLLDTATIARLIHSIEPHEIYNLGAQSHVQVSFYMPEFTAQTDALGTLRILEAIRLLGWEKKVKFYQASSSEMFGKVREIPQKETTPFYPRSPYAVSKVFAFWLTVNYREAYGMYAVNGILFNHESPRRGETFVTRKITRAVGRIFYGLQKTLYLGNLNARRDWGHARDFVEAIWLMMQQPEPDDYVVATGKATSVREFCQKAFATAGIDIEFQGQGLDEMGVVTAVHHPDAQVKPGDVVVRIDPRYFRPTEVDILVGDPSKAREKLGWQPRYTLDDLIKEMVEHDLEEARKEALLKKEGFNLVLQQE